MALTQTTVEAGSGVGPGRRQPGTRKSRRRSRRSGRLAVKTGHPDDTESKTNARPEDGSDADARSDSPQLRPCVETILELVDSDGRRAASDKLRRSATERVSRCPWLCKQADALEGTLVGSSRGQARQTHSAYLAAAEQIVTDTSQQMVLRCYAFWRCLEAWAALRFGDHRGLALGDCSLTDDAFRGTLARTKTTGKDKKIQSRVIHVQG